MTDRKPLNFDDQDAPVLTEREIERIKQDSEEMIIRKERVPKIISTEDGW